jgi:hypothetical protein
LFREGAASSESTNGNLVSRKKTSIEEDTKNHHGKSSVELNLDRKVERSSVEKDTRSFSGERNFDNAKLDENADNTGQDHLYS